MKKVILIIILGILPLAGASLVVFRSIAAKEAASVASSEKEVSAKSARSLQKKIDAVDALASQVYETVYGVDAKTRQRQLDSIPKDAAGRRAWAEKSHGERSAGVANDYRDELAKRYGEARAKTVKYAEAFEICEYGRQPTEEEIRKLFPFFPEK